MAGFVARVLMGKACLPGFVAREEEGRMVISVGHHMRAAVNQLLFEALVKFREFRPVNPGMVVMLGVKAYIEHREVEKVRHKYGGVADRLGGSFRNTARVLNIHSRIHNERVGDPVRQRPKEYGHDRVDPERNRPESKKNNEFLKRSPAQGLARGEIFPEVYREAPRPMREQVALKVFKFSVGRVFG